MCSGRGARAQRASCPGRGVRGRGREATRTLALQSSGPTSPTCPAWGHTQELLPVGGPFLTGPSARSHPVPTRFLFRSRDPAPRSGWSWAVETRLPRAGPATAPSVHGVWGQGSHTARVESEPVCGGTRKPPSPPRLLCGAPQPPGFTWQAFLRCLPWCHPPWFRARASGLRPQSGPTPEAPGPHTAPERPLSPSGRLHAAHSGEAGESAPC